MVEAFARVRSGAAALFAVRCLRRIGPPSSPRLRPNPPAIGRSPRRTDRVTGAKILNVKLEARKTAHDGLFLPPDALLQLGCLKNHPLIHFTFAFQIGSKGNSEISYRFDEQPAQPVEARILRGLKIVVIEDKKAVAKFVDELATATTLYFVISSLDKGRTSAEFRVAGAQTPIEWIAANCGAKTKNM